MASDGAAVLPQMLRALATELLTEPAWPAVPDAYGSFSQADAHFGISGKECRPYFHACCGASGGLSVCRSGLKEELSRSREAYQVHLATLQAKVGSLADCAESLARTNKMLELCLEHGVSKADYFQACTSFALPADGRSELLELQRGDTILQVHARIIGSELGGVLKQHVSQMSCAPIDLTAEPWSFCSLDAVCIVLAAAYLGPDDQQIRIAVDGLPERDLVPLLDLIDYLNVEPVQAAACEQAASRTLCCLADYCSNEQVMRASKRRRILNAAAESDA